jgi:6-phosphogluconate dehydrogenase
MLNNIGLIGLSTMGGNLSRNIANKGYKISVYNRTYKKTTDLLDLSSKLDSAETRNNIVGYENLKDFVESLELPRKVILLVKSGDPVDEILVELKPLLSSLDIVIDAGNSNWQDTITREIILEDCIDFEDELNDDEEMVLDQKTIYFLGCGISGGAEGALNGPSIMLSGHKESCDAVMPILQAIAAKDFEGNPCVANFGENPAGHFVKMVHNGIEYSLMQGIAEVYDILKTTGLDLTSIKQVFEELNTGNNQSYLLDITNKILETKDSLSSDFLINKIKQVSDSKGTGKWSIESALELEVSVPNIFSALNARITSKDLNNFIVEKMPNDLAELDFEVTELNNLLQLIFLTSYIQGLELILAAETNYGWGIKIEEVLRVWQGGCIIRSKWLEYLPKLLSDKLNYTSVLKELLASSLISQSKLLALNLPVITSSIGYLKDLLYNQTGQSLIQAQRDYFGQHGFERIDKEGSYSGGWNR